MNKSLFLFIYMIVLAACGQQSGQTSNADITDDRSPLEGEITSLQLIEAMEDERTLLIDVREYEELVETGQIAGSVHLPLSELKAVANPSSMRYDSMFSKADQIIFTCRSGRRAQVAVETLKKYGFEKAVVLRGGILEWLEENQPVLSVDER